MQAPGDETSKGGDHWRGKIRCVPSPDETDSCLVASDRARCARGTPQQCKIQTPFQNILGFPGRTCPAINQSINQAQIAFPRPCSANLQAPCHGCHAHDATPTSLLRRTTHGDMGDSGPHTILHTGIINSCIGGNKGLNCAPQTSIGYVTDTRRRRNSGFNFPSPRSQDNQIYELQQTDLGSYIGGGWQ
jgi:hypothetical protein